MRFAQKEIVLKNGELCCLRSPEAGDAAALLDYLRRVYGETENMLRYPEEVTSTVKEEEQLIQNANDGGTGMLISAFYQGRIVGNLGLNPIGSGRKVRHRADVGLAVEKALWGQGLGGVLLAEALDAAALLGYEQVELEVLASNERGLRLYRRAGFVEYGRRERAFRQKDGHYEAEILMCRALRQ